MAVRRKAVRHKAMHEIFPANDKLEYLLREYVCHMDTEMSKSPGGPNPGQSKKFILCIAVTFFIILPSLAISAFAYDFVGTVEKISEPNGMIVNVTQPGTYGLQAKVEVLLDKPLSTLSSFMGKELQFDILGHDILGRPVCDAYLAGTNIRDVSYCQLNPVDCNYARHSRDYYRYYDYAWEGRVYEWPEGYIVTTPCQGDCPPNFPNPYPYPWLSLV